MAARYVAQLVRDGPLERTADAVPDVAVIRQRVRVLADDVAKVFAGATSEARRALRALLTGKIEMEPFGRGRRRGYRFRGELTIGRIITGVAGETRPKMVAPTGFDGEACLPEIDFGGVALAA